MQIKIKTTMGEDIQQVDFFKAFLTMSGVLKEIIEYLNAQNRTIYLILKMGLSG